MRHRLGDQIPQQIAVVRALRGLGDLLCVVPALRALRCGLPDAHLTLIGLPSAAWFVRRFYGYLDGLIEFPGYPGIPEAAVSVADLPSFLARMQAMRFDLAIQMHGSGGASNPFTVLLGARHTSGFFVPGQYCPDPERFIAYPEEEPEIRRHLRLVERLGLPLQGDHLEFPVYGEDRAELARLPECAGLRPGGYVCLHPGAHDPARRWPPKLFAQAADGLADEGLQVVLTGAKEEAPLVEAVARQLAAPATNLAGRTSLGALAALLEGACLLISNDTGVSHLAAALRTPSVVIFLASDPERWAPLDRELHRCLRWPVLGGAGSAEHRADPHPARSILPLATPGRVLVEARALLAGNPARNPVEPAHAV